MSEVPYCPIRDGECAGTRCAMSVRLDHANVNTLYVIWKCGLVHDVDTRQYGRARTIAAEKRVEW